MSADVGRAGEAVARFLGVGRDGARGEALGPILWQFAPTRKFEPGAMAEFLDHLPARMKHAIEMRHPSALDPRLVEMLAERQVALAGVERPGEPMRVERTAPFAYVRVETTVDGLEAGLTEEELASWAKRLRGLAATGDVFAYVISGAKHRNPAAARALQELCP